MAIPNNYIDKITNKDTGDSRIISPAAAMVRVENEHFEGADLDEVLDEVAQAIEDAGSGDGTVTGVKMNNGQPISPDENGVVDLGNVITDVSNKVDKVTGYGLSKNDYSDTDKTKLAGIEAGAEVNVINGIKANGASETLPVDQNGVVELPPAGSTISPATAAPLEDGTAGVGSSEKYAREDHRHPHDSSKQDTLTWDDVPTSGHTTQVMSSDKIKTALDNLLQNLTIGQNGNWYVGQTDTGVKAQGPQGNCNITDASQLVTILVNDLTTGGAGNILSAEMGKVLKEAVSTLIDSMGEYCFPLGRPTLSWEGAKADIITNFNNTHVTSTNTAQRVDIGARFETTLGTDDNLYVIDDDTVVVKMGNVVQSGAYSAATGKVTISEVTGTVEIIANAITYEQTGLAFQLDCMNRGGQSGHWIDRIGNVDFKLTNVTEDDTGMVFNGLSSKAVVMDDNTPSQYAIGTKYVDVAFDAGVIEIIAIADTLPVSGGTMQMPLFINPRQRGIMSHFNIGSTGRYNGKLIMCFGMSASGSTNGHYSLFYNAGTNIAISVQTNEFNGSLVRFNGVTQSATWYDTWIGQYNNSALSVGYRYNNNNGTVTEQFFKGTIKAIRVYNTKLNEQQMIQNYKVDKKRFNLA